MKTAYAVSNNFDHQAWIKAMEQVRPQAMKQFEDIVWGQTRFRVFSLFGRCVIDQTRE